MMLSDQEIPTFDKFKLDLELYDNYTKLRDKIRESQLEVLTSFGCAEVRRIKSFVNFAPVDDIEYPIEADQEGSHLLSF